VLFLLKVVNLESLTRSDCNVNLYPDSTVYQASFSGILRVGMAASYISQSVNNDILFFIDEL
jgi:hypothetical protein